MINETYQDSQLPNNYYHSFKSNLDNKILIFIYQITCKDPNINENYIGQTECFENRKYSHSRDSQTSELKIYKTIREYGGWDNWEMKIINHYYCNNEYEARQIEQKYIDVFKATMNSVRAYSKTFINEELDRQLEFEINDYTDKILGCYLYDYHFDINLQIECNFCKSILKTNSSLNYHMKNNKKCLEIQKEKNPNMEKIIKKDFKCEYCNKLFSSKNNLILHINTCKSKIETLKKESKIYILEKENIKKNIEIEDLKNELIKKNLEIAELKGILKSKSEILESEHACILQMARQPKNNTHTNNNIQNILAPLNLDAVLDKFNNVNFTNKDIIDGQAGVARLLAPCLTDNSGKQMIKVSDISRGIFTSIDDSGNIIKDIKAQKLAIAIEPIATEKVNKIIELDDIKRDKILELCILKKNKKERENEIQRFSETMLGISSKLTLKHYREQIENRKKRNEIDQQKINDYIEEGIDEITVEEMDLIILKMRDGLEDIKELKTNSNKFSSILSKVIE